ncbi:hypothetical protein FQN54_002514 [Arachnomyces sp. PD_36]|nr:hypothetical protein FQN54_002514 [Arachnomyces sp. PD_36]
MSPRIDSFIGVADLYYVTGSSGFGCQVADHEVIPYRNHDRSGEDDGSLWTGETFVQISDRYYAKDSDDVKIECSGTFHLPTVFWIGPYLQGEDGTNNNIAIGMLAFETNGTTKSDAWHAYRPCISEYLDSDTSSPGVWNPSPSAFEIMAGVHYSDSTPPPDNTTIGLSLIPPPPGTNYTGFSSPGIYFNGTFNDIKEADDYFTDGGPGPDFTFHLETNLSCTRTSKEFDWEFPEGSHASILPGSLVNGTLQ